MRIVLDKRVYKGTVLFIVGALFVLALSLFCPTHIPLSMAAKDSTATPNPPVDLFELTLEQLLNVKIVKG